VTDEPQRPSLEKNPDPEPTPGAGSWGPPPAQQQPYAQGYPQTPFPQADQPQGQPYGQPAGQAYGQQPYGAYPGGPAPYQPSPVPIPTHLLPPPDHPRAMTSMILGAVGLFIGLSTGIGFLLSPFAWAIGSGALKEIEASQGRVGGASAARAGKIMGIVGTVLLGLGVLALAGLIAVLFATASTSP
jgi:hypothetical protein